ncbi:MAG: DUF4140 domain-containing protein, partial [Myxococcota bacterium]|nr:DUF4140 domain-containing protein [Myxococcota bacterium]
MQVADLVADLAQVTVYATGARVRRVTTMTTGTVNGGTPRVRIVGLPASVIDDTVRVEVEGSAIATGVRVAVAAPGEPDAAAEERPALRVARRELEVAESEVERLEAALERLASAPVIAPDPTDDPPAAWSAVVAARRSIVGLRADRELALRDQLAAARRAVDVAELNLDAELDREQRIGSVHAPKLHELRKHVELELIATGTGELTLHLEYQVAAARWAPSYVARLDGDSASLELRAVVAQDTGEDWTGVPLQLSTAEPARFAVLP